MTTATVTIPMNVTYEGISSNVFLPVDPDTELTDELVLRTTEEMLRAGTAGTLHLPDLPKGALVHFRVDRRGEQDALRIVVRPGTPFGGVA